MIRVGHMTFLRLVCEGLICEGLICQRFKYSIAVDMNDIITSSKNRGPNFVIFVPCGKVGKSYVVTNVIAILT